MNLGWLNEVTCYGSEDWGLISSRFRAFSYCDQIQIDLGPTQFPLHVLQVQEPEHQVNSCLHLVTQLRMHAAFPPVLHISKWCGAWAWKLMSLYLKFCISLKSLKYCLLAELLSASQDSVPWSYTSSLAISSVTSTMWPRRKIKQLFEPNILQ